MSSKKSCKEQQIATLYKGGRMTKYKGIVASCPPLGLFSTAAGSFKTRASYLALGAALALSPFAMGGGAYAGSCTESGTSSGIWSCAGQARTGDTPQDLNPSPVGTVTATTDPGFGIDTSTGTALTLENTAGSTGDITFTDDNNSDIKGSDVGIGVINNGTGKVLITSTGSVFGQSDVGIGVQNSSATGGSVTINAASASGAAGIGVDNDGQGAVEITTTGNVSGNSQSGIRVDNDLGSNVTITTKATVEGETQGINVLNKETTGATVTRITAEADVTGKTQSGIEVKTSIAAGGTPSANTQTVVIEANSVTGETNGIDVLHEGPGVASITATGTVTGNNDDGIKAANSSDSNALNITTVAVVGDDDGINATHNGSSDLTITSTGNVSGAKENGILARGSTNGDKVTINVTGNVGGQKIGIDAENLGSESLDIAVTGDITGTTQDGIKAHGDGDGLSVNVRGKVTAQNTGINADHDGDNALAITVTGAVTGRETDGIAANNSTKGTTLTINAAEVNGDDNGITATNDGTGELSITATSTVTGSKDDGITATNNVSGDLTITSEAVSGGKTGIRADNNNTGTGGTLTITAKNTVEGKDGDGIFTDNAINGTGTTITATKVTGSQNGINAANNGDGALNVTISDDVVGTANNGILAVNKGTELNIIARKSVTGNQSGIDADNDGNDKLTITADGDVTGTTSYGINASNISGSKSLTITTKGVVRGKLDGINADNDGSEKLEITATGNVIGDDGNGINAQNSADSSDLIISATNAVTGNQSGINANNDGTGELSITATGDVTGTTQHGINAGNSTSGTDLKINAVKVTGDTIGINASNGGTGELSITATGDVTGAKVNGINANNSAAGTDLKISAVKVTGSTNGIFADNDGTGELSITATGDVTGTSQDGINAQNSSNSTKDLTITTSSAITGGDDGIDAVDAGSGVLRVTTSGTVTGQDDGIDVTKSGTNKAVIVVSGNVTGGDNGIEAEHSGVPVPVPAPPVPAPPVPTPPVPAPPVPAPPRPLGFPAADERLSITISSEVKGGTGAGIDSKTVSGKGTTIVLNSGAKVGATSGKAILNNEGDSDITVNTGALVVGSIELGDGDDAVNFAGGDYSGVTLFDGGDDTSATDTFTDELTLNSGSMTLVGSRFQNWEKISLENGTYSFSDNALTAGDTGTGTGLFLKNNSILEASSAFALTGNLDIDSGSSFATKTGGNLAHTVSGSVNNAGTIDLRDGATGDSLTIEKDYSGTGTLGVDVDFDTKTADTLVVKGDVTGSTKVAITSVSSTVPKGDDILIVDVTGSSVANAFTLSGQSAFGAYQYSLTEKTSDWYLNAKLLEQVPTYEAYPRALQELIKVDTFHSRAANRTVVTGDGQSSNIWFAVYNSNTDVTPSSSTTSLTFDSKVSGFKVGVDIPLNTGQAGTLVGGLNLSLGSVTMDVTSAAGNGKIESNGKTIGGTISWIGNSGFYAEAQTKLGSFDSTVYDVKNDGSGSALSLELGTKLALSSSFSITPQVQFSSSSVDFDTLTGKDGEKVSLKTGDASSVRFGVSMEKSWGQATNGDTQSSIYGLLNIHQNQDTKTEISISGDDFNNTTIDRVGEVGVGGQYSWNDSKSVVYGEVRALQGMGDDGDLKGTSAQFGLRWKF